jgi:hypothetical protein
VKCERTKRTKRTKRKGDIEDDGDEVGKYRQAEGVGAAGYADDAGT